MIKNPWQSKEWLKKRDERLKDEKCELCNSTEDLSIHHPDHLFETPFQINRRMYSQFYQEFQNLFMKKHKIKPKATGAHRHKSHPYWHPIDRKHKYEVDESEMETQYKTPKPTPDQKKTFKEEYNEWLNSINAKSLINAELEKERASYMSFENVQVLCNRCHIAHHKGMDLCPVCNSNYKNKRYETCWECVPEEQKKKIEERKSGFEKWLKEVQEFADNYDWDDEDDYY
ncbi:hypothetical protein [uncultured Methanolobus sp.]|uniref:hypothetical protein n=1 Tax=uncultured Methanolobus sp. TaxID=218300 RepID=UPI0029C911A7|nr:hypothetical protein [uncultured Methanolobus sp.]